MSDAQETVVVSSPGEFGSEPIKTNVVQDAIATVDVSKYNLNVFDELYAKIRGMIANKEFNAGNWITLATMAMEMVETLPHLTGHEKRDLVVDLVTKLVAEIPMAENQRSIVQAILSTALPVLIDVIVDASLGVYAINLIEEAKKKCNGCIGKKAAAKGARGVRARGVQDRKMRKH